MIIRTRHTRSCMRGGDRSSPDQGRDTPQSPPLVPLAVGGRPPPERRAQPGELIFAQCRRRHLRAVSSQMPSFPAMAWLATPAVATARSAPAAPAGTVLRRARDRDSSSARSASPEADDIGTGRLAVHGATPQVGTMAVWQGHLSRPRLRCASGWPRGRASAGPSSGITVRWHGEFAYVAAAPDGTALPPDAAPLRRLCHHLRICHLQPATTTTRIRPAQRLPSRHPQEALDCACGLYLGDTTAWLDPPPPRRINGATTSEVDSID